MLGSAGKREVSTIRSSASFPIRLIISLDCPGNARQARQESRRRVHRAKMVLDYLCQFRYADFTRSHSKE
jgi:hypothetical protein